MFFPIRRIVCVLLGLFFIGGMVTGCVTVTQGPAPRATVSIPPPPPLPIDTTKSLPEQVEELKVGFAKVYCPVRESPVADAIVTEAKGIWNKLAADAKRDNIPIPEFDPNDPKMCQDQ